MINVGLNGSDRSGRAIAPRILVTTEPFGTIDPRPLELLRATGWEYMLNPVERTLTEEEMISLVEPYHGIVAGTEPISKRVLDHAPNLRIICRVGVGLDSVDLVAARRRGVEVSYTPEAPAPAVAELAVGLMLDLLRYVSRADRGVRAGQWVRYMGRRLAECTVGIVGVGRIGKRVIRHLSGLGPRILTNDLAPDLDFGIRYGVEWVDRQELLRCADVISVHLPLTPLTHYYIGTRELALMKPDAILINTARGEIVDLEALEVALSAGQIGAAAIDVYEQEPYSGPLSKFDNVIFTCHMGSCSQDCRLRMELEATEECIRFLSGEAQRTPVPEEEYEMRQEDVRYLVTVRPDATFHHMGSGDVLASVDTRFREYRRRWYESPARFKVEPFPLHLDIEVTGPSDPNYSIEANLIDFDLVKKILYEGARSGLCGVKFGFRGQPLRNPRLPEMVAYAKELGIMDVYIKTEAENLSREMGVALIQAGLDRITLTVNGWDDRSYEAEYPGNSFDQVVANIEALREEREARSALRPRVRVQTYLTSQLMDRVDSYSNFWRSKVDEVAYVELDYQSKESQHRGISAEWACAKLWQSLCITWNGCILPCNHDFEAEIVLGIANKDSIKDVWHNQQLEEMRHLHQEGLAHHIPICDKCVLRFCEISKLET